MFPNLPESIISWLQTKNSDLPQLIWEIKSVLETAKSSKIDSATKTTLDKLITLLDRFSNTQSFSRDRIIEILLKICYLYEVVKLKMEVREEVTSTDLDIISKEIQRSIPTKVTLKKQKELLAFIESKKWNSKTEILDTSIEKQVQNYIEKAIFKITQKNGEQIPAQLKEKFFKEFAIQYIAFCKEKKIPLKEVLHKTPEALETSYYIWQGWYRVPAQKWVEYLISKTFSSLKLTSEERALILDLRIRFNENPNSSVMYLFRVFGEQIWREIPPQSPESLEFIQFFKNIQNTKEIDLKKFSDKFNDFKEFCYQIIKGVIFEGKENIVIYNTKTQEKVSISYDEQRDTILSNLLIFMAYTLHIESSFNNNSISPLSTASGYGQIPNGNFGWVVNMGMLDKFWEFPTWQKNKKQLRQESLGIAYFHTSLLQKIPWLSFPESINEKLRNINTLIWEHNSDFWLRASDLPSQEQIILMLWNIFGMSQKRFSGNIRKWIIQRKTSRGRTIIYDVKEYLQRWLLLADDRFFAAIYARWHHTYPEEDTQARMKEKGKIYTPLLQQVNGRVVDTLQKIPHQFQEILKRITWKNVDIKEWQEQKIFVEILQFLFPNITSWDTKSLLLSFQNQENIAGWDGTNYWPSTKKRLWEILIEILEWRSEKYNRVELVKIFQKYATQMEVEDPQRTDWPKSFTQWEISPEKLVLTNVSLMFNKLIETRLWKPYSTATIDFFQKKGFNIVYTSTTKITDELSEHKKEYLELLWGDEREFNKILATTKKPFAKKKYGSNYSTRVYQSYLDLSRKGKFPWFIKDFESAKKFWLVELPVKTDLWRIRPFRRAWTSKENISILRSLHPRAKKVLEEICRDFQKKVSSHWLWKWLQVRLVLNSLTRPISYNRLLREKASKFSAHATWLWFDIAHSFFDIYNETTWIYTTITNSTRVNKTDIYHQYRSLLVQTLLEFDIAGKIVLTQEWDHPHITVIE